MKKPAPKASADTVALYKALLATIPEIERKGATMPYTSVNGKMFSLMTADSELALRLPSPEREAFLKKYKTTLSVQHGVELKEYVRVPSSLLKKTSELAPYLAISFQYAQSLKAKPTTKKKPAKPASPKK